MNNIDKKDIAIIEAISKWQNINLAKTGDDWYYFSKESLGKQVGLSRSQTIIHLNKVINEGFVKRHDFVPRLLKVTEKWYVLKNSVPLRYPASND